MAATLPFCPYELNQPRDQRPHLDWAGRLPILVTGVAGVVGFNLFHYLQLKYPGQVIGIRPRVNWRLTGEGIVGVDPEDRQQLRELFLQYPFRSILNCGGSCALKSCELDPAMAQRVNVSSVESLLEVAAEMRPPGAPPTRLVHLSIDLVYSGEGPGGYLETDPTDPVTVYGKTMVQAEQLLQAGRPDAAVLRISLPMGLSFNGHAGAIDWIQSRFAKGFPATLYYDELRTPTYCECLNEVLETMLAGEWGGLYHAGGPTRLSLYQIAQIVNLVGGYDPDLLQGCLRLEAGPVPPRAGDVTMDSGKLVQLLGRPVFRPWPEDPRLIPTDPQWHYRREGLPTGSPAEIARCLYRVPRAPTFPSTS